MPALTVAASFAVALICAGVAQASFSFSEHSYSVGTLSSGWPQTVAVGDFNNDKHADVAVSENSSPVGMVSILLGDGTGALGTATNVPTGDDSAQDVAVGDFNDDHNQDLVVSHYNSDGHVSVLLGNGDGTFQSAVPYPLGAAATAVTVGDFNEDGAPDIAAAISLGSVSVRLNKNDGSGTFNSPFAYSTPHSAWPVATADVTGDGHLDLLVGEPGSTSNVELLTGNGHGSFSLTHEFPLASGGGNLQGAIAVGDLNGDGRPDLAAPGWDGGTLSVLINTGMGGASTFGSATPYSTGYGTFAAQMADFDLNGHRDVAIASKAGSSVGVLAGDGSGGLGSVESAGASSNAADLKIADFNEDGRPDIVSAAGGSNSADVFLNTTTPSPNAAPRASTGGASRVDDQHATLLGIVDPHGLPTTYHFEYGTTTAYGATGSPTTDQNAGNDNGDTVVSTDLDGLTPSTIYHYRLVAHNLGGTTYGADRTFTTAAAPSGGGGGGAVAPTAETGDASALTGSSATLLGIVGPGGLDTTYYFEYGKTTGYGAGGSPTPTRDAGADNSFHAAAADISGLDADTLYHYRLVAHNASGTTYGADRTFTTRADIPPEVTVLSVGSNPPNLEQTSAYMGGNVDPKGQSGVGYRFEWGIQGGPLDQSSSTQALAGSDPQGVVDHRSGLLPNTGYHFRIVATYHGNDYPSREETFHTLYPILDPLANPSHKIWAEHVTTTSAEVDASVDGRGDKAAAQFTLHPTQGGPDVVVTSGQVWGSGGRGTAYTTAQNLLPGTHYKVTVTLLDVAGGAHPAGSTVFFDTLPAPPKPQGSAPVSTGGATLTVACVNRSACAGDLTLERTNASIASAAAQHPAPLVLGHARFKIAARHSKRIRVPLTKAGRRLVRHHRRLTVLAVTRENNPAGGPPIVRSHRVTLIAHR